MATSCCFHYGWIWWHTDEDQQNLSGIRSSQSSLQLQSVLGDWLCVCVCFRWTGWQRRWERPTSRCRRCTETCLRKRGSPSWRSSDQEPGNKPEPCSPTDLTKYLLDLKRFVNQSVDHFLFCNYFHHQLILHHFLNISLLSFSKTSRVFPVLSRVLISTDVWARGLDVPQVSLIINYDLPNNRELYIHRYTPATYHSTQSSPTESSTSTGTHL